MSINDVWRNIGREIGVYCKGQHHKVPAQAGIYAWFYPLRVVELDLDKLISELSLVFCFDAKSCGVPRAESDVEFTWYRIRMSLTQHPRHNSIPHALKNGWSGIVNDPIAFGSFRRNLMRSSIFLPPLYIGKSRNLYGRCWTHINDPKPGSFHDRFERYAVRQGLSAKSVEELIFACVATEESSDFDTAEDSSTDILEALINIAARPPYGVKPT